ncbi:MAG: alpha/beta hydrolase [Rhizobiaceae bacterium]|nr:alpha/beta hydrolase [Rhizobiaceae bacterium]
MLGLLHEGFPAIQDMDAVDARAAVAARARPVENIDDVRSAEDRRIADGLRVRIYRPWSEPQGETPAILFLHGGGFVFCSIESHDGFCRRVSKNTSSVVVSVDYRLAPEHRAPAAAEDAYLALTWLSDNAAELGLDRNRILVAGDSAGGNLAAVACLMARDRGSAMPLGQVLIYPVIAPDFQTESYRSYATGYFNTRAAMQWYWCHYLGGEKLPEPAEYAAPLWAATHSGLPPALVYTAGRDPLCSEGEQYATALRAAGVPVRHRNFPDLFHGFATIPGFGPAEGALKVLWRDIDGFLGLQKEVSA